MAAKKAKTAKKVSKKTNGNGDGAAKGYKGHRKGTIKEQLHIIFDKHAKDPEKAKAEAKKIKGVAPATINTSFSQFRNA